VFASRPTSQVPVEIPEQGEHCRPKERSVVVEPPLDSQVHPLGQFDQARAGPIGELPLVRVPYVRTWRCLVWFITGSSRGFGLEIARRTLERGDAVVASARDPGQVQATLPGFGDRLVVPALDVTNEDQAREAVAQAMQRYTRIDVLVN